MREAEDGSFSLQALLDIRGAAEQASDEAERRRHLAAFAAYAEAFVAHVPRREGEVVEALLLARYFSFLPLALAEISEPIRADIEAALEAVKRDAAITDVLEPLWRVLAAIDAATRDGRWVADELDMPIATVTRHVLGWARAARAT